MRLIHTADLHIGKTVNEFSLIEDQQYFLRQIIELVEREHADGLLIAGDVYDRSIPSAEAVTLLDGFLSELIQRKVPVLMISGNHDSPERVGFAGKILEKEGLYIASNPLEGAKCVTLTKSVPQNGEGSTGGEEPVKNLSKSTKARLEQVHIVLMPYVKPSVLGVKTNQEAVERMLKKVEEEHPELQEMDACKILMTHYFVTNAGKEPELSDSETTVNVGGLDNVEASVFAGYDYVALGHIHKPQQIGEQQIYYAGTPMKYSFSETNQEKGVNLICMEEKTENKYMTENSELMEKNERTGKVSVTRLPLTLLHDMRKITGRLEELIAPEVVQAADSSDYIQATLSNEEELIDPIGTLRSVYPNTMQLILAKNNIQGRGIDVTHIQKSKTILELYEEFYQIVRGETLPEDRRKIVLQIVKEEENI
ncbi:MAG: exonuclease SbcCD subunit D [Lachnospiraceae bacterium]|nr:exonuclease SbcCD subunit D [Lachnospiraceae bacterium]